MADGGILYIEHSLEFNLGGNNYKASYELYSRVLKI